MYAPVVSRFDTYGVDSPRARARLYGPDAGAAGDAGMEDSRAKRKLQRVWATCRTRGRTAPGKH